MTAPGLMRSTVWGIDLGTTYSCIARVDPYGRPEVLRNADGQHTTPSVVLFDTPTEVVVGVQAKRQTRIRPEQIASHAKRHMGDAQWRFRVHGQDYSAAAVSSQTLRSLANDAERVTGQKVTDVVITVPAYFGDGERKATKLAGELAGLRVVDIINEPTAAAFAYGFGLADLASAQERTMLVYDLGGGTFDTSVIRLSAGSISVIATDGDHELGGADWDDRLASHLSARFVEQCPGAGDPMDDVYGAQDLLTEAEQAKQSLSTRESVDVLLVHNGARTSITVTRADLEELTSSLLDRTMDLTGKVLVAAAAKGASNIDTVLLVGGMSKSPAVTRRLEAHLGVAPVISDPDLAVAKGASLYGQKQALEEFIAELDTATPQALGEALAASARAYGLTYEAVQALVGTEVSIVTSRGFGILALDDDSQDVRAVFFAHRNDALPIQVEQTFYTVEDDQNHVTVRVVEQATQVESVREGDNKVVIEGLISGIPSGSPRGTPVTITFAMHRDQTIEVTALHQGVAEPLVMSVMVGLASEAARLAESVQVTALSQGESLSLHS